jgi:hypothetical protein
MRTAYRYAGKALEEDEDMKPFLAALVVTVGGALASAGAGGAAQPVGNCPPSFQPMTISQLTELVVSLGFPHPIELLQAELASLDTNDDDLLCVLDFPNTPGTKAYQFNVVDNTARVPS